MNQSRVGGDDSAVHPAVLPEAELAEQCELRFGRRSGPGGQHRNKVETAVVITHLPTGVRGEASERRSQAANRREAWKRLRINLVLQVRQSWQGPSKQWRSAAEQGRPTATPGSIRWAAQTAECLDALETCQWRLSTASDRLELPTAQIVRLLQSHPQLWQHANLRRRQTGLKPLRT